MPMNSLDAAERVLKEAGEPLHYKEITKRVLAQALWATRGKTPARTVNAQITSDRKRYGERSRFINCNKPGVFGLRDAGGPSKVSRVPSLALASSRRTRSRKKDLTDLEKAIEKARNDYSDNQNESDVRRFAVEPILNQLGWNSPKVMKTEHPVGPAEGKKETVDYALRCRRRNQVIVEVKFGPLSSDHRGQLRKYCHLARVSLGALTNGQIWQLYYGMNTGRKNNLAKVIDISQADLHAVGRWLEEFLSLRNIERGDARKAFKSALEQQINHQKSVKVIQKRWNEILPKVVEQAKKALEEAVPKTISANAVHAFVQEWFSSKGQVALDSKDGVSEVSVPEQQPNLERKSASRSPSRQRPVPETRPEAVEVFGRQVPVKSWREIVLVFLDEVYKKKQKEFLTRVVNRRPQRFVRSTVEPTSIRIPRQIGESDVWVSGHGSADTHWGVCESVRTTLGLPEDVLTLR